MPSSFARRATAGETRPVRRAVSSPARGAKTDAISDVECLDLHAVRAIENTPVCEDAIDIYHDHSDRFGLFLDFTVDRHERPRLNECGVRGAGCGGRKVW